MSITAGYLPVPAPGRWTSPTRFTPSLAVIVTSGSVVMSAACAGAAAMRPPASARTATTRAGSRSTSRRVKSAPPRRAGSTDDSTPLRAGIFLSVSHPYLEEEGRISRSARLIGIAWDVVKRDRAMLCLAGLAAIANIVGALLIFKLAGWHAGHRMPQQKLLLVAAISAYPLTLLGVFLNVAVAAAA